MNSPYRRIVWTVQESMKMRHGSASKGLFGGVCSGGATRISIARL
jgi:hypothetical protein